MSRSRRWAALGLASAAALATASLHAQTTQTDAETIYFGQRQQTEEPTLYVAPWHGSFDFMATQANAHTSSTGASDTNNRETLFQETLTLYTGGYIVHPNLVEYHFSVTGGLTQDHVSETDQGSDNSTGTVYGWDINAVIMRNQPASVTLYSRRSDATLEVPFGDVQKTTTTITGARLDYHTTETTMQVDAYHETETQSAFSSSDDNYSLNRDVLTGHGDTQLSTNQTLNWNFELQRATYDSGTSSSEDSAAGSVVHGVSFGDGNRNSLGSSLGYSQVTGEFDEKDFRWNEHLHLNHAPNFDTNYDYTYEQLTYGGATTDVQTAYMDARHQLYKSLTTTGRLGWQDVTTGANSVQTYTSDLNLNYRKNVTDGMFMADAFVGYQQQDISGSGVANAPTQPIVFVGVTPITVSQTGAIPSSVVIRDAATGRIYNEGTDYTVSGTPVGLQIDRVLGGNIPDGQPLLMSYQYDPLDATQVDTETFGLGFRYQFTKGPLAGLTPYFRFSGQDQQITGGTAVPNSVRDYIAGTLYQVGDFTFRGEREWCDSTLYPFDAWRYEARYDHTFSSQTSGAVGVTYTDTQYYDPDQNTKTYSLNLSATQRITPELSVSAYGAYAHVVSDSGGTTDGIGEGLEVDWYHRQTKVYVRLRNASLDTDTSHQDFQFFQLGLTRRF